MVKNPKKAKKNITNTINSILPENKPQPKSRQQILPKEQRTQKTATQRKISATEKTRGIIC